MRPAPLLPLAFVLALAACQPGAPGGGPAGGAAEPRAGDMRDAPAAEAAGEDAAGGGSAAGTPPGHSDAAAAAAEGEDGAGGQAVRGAAAGEAAAGEAGDGVRPSPPPEPDPFAAARAACEAGGGLLGRAPGGTEARVCLRTPDDANRPCRTGAECEGACLARSRTCAPVVPLLGCNDVILSNGMVATECIE